MTSGNEIYDGCNSSDCGHWGCFDMNEKDAEIERLAKEVKEAKAKYKDLNDSLMAELRDPYGTIWEHAKSLQDDNDSLRAEIESLKKDRDELKDDVLRWKINCNAPTPKESDLNDRVKELESLIAKIKDMADRRELARYEYNVYIECKKALGG